MMAHQNKTIHLYETAELYFSFRYECEDSFVKLVRLSATYVIV